MPATVFPLPISISQVKAHFVGLGDLLTAAEEYSGLTTEQLLGQHIKGAQGDLEQITRIPFFATRFCTKVLAEDDSLTLGTDFDRYVSPMDYDTTQMKVNTGRIDLPWKFVNSLEKLSFRMPEADQPLVEALPDSWLTRDDEQGTIHILPHGNTAGVSIYFKLFGLYPYYRPGLATGVVPGLIHVRYTAGLVTLPDPMSDYDPLDPDTIWDPEMVRGYQVAIGQLASAPVMEKIASELDKGGASISFDGLSESVNPQVLIQRAQQNRQSAKEWAQTLKEQIHGPTWVFV